MYGAYTATNAFTRPAGTLDAVRDACVYAHVSAGLAIEQRDLPHVEYTEGGGELWNGTKVTARVAAYRGRLGI